jgi:hypothetical protein
MESLPRVIGRTALLAVLALAAGCRTTPPSAPLGPTDPVAAGRPDANWAQVLRWRDDSGLAHNDQRTVSSPAELARLRRFFPDLATQSESSLHGSWPAWVVVHFHRANGTDTYVSTDYRIYRIDDGSRGDFVLAPGFIDYVYQLFTAPAPAAPAVTSP